MNASKVANHFLIMNISTCIGIMKPLLPVQYLKSYKICNSDHILMPLRHWNICWCIMNQPMLLCPSLISLTAECVETSLKECGDDEIVTDVRRTFSYLQTLVYDQCLGPCAAQPCVNGGTCVPDGMDYVCECPFQYTGENCEIGGWLYCVGN